MPDRRPISVALTLGVQVEGGISRYTIGLARQLLDRDDIELTALGSRASLDLLMERAPGRRANREIVIPTTNGAAEGLWTRQLLDRTLGHRPVDLIHCSKTAVPADASVPVVLTVHDLTLIDRRNEYARLKTAVMPRIFDQAVRGADWWITVSQSVADDLERRYPTTRGRVDAVGNTVTALSPVGEPVAGVASPFAFAIGDLSPRKNFGFLARLWPDVFERTGMQLIVAGSEGWRAEETRTALTALEQRGMGRYVGRVSERELRWLYEQAAVTCVPSLNEGFGLAVVEASSVGCPVVSSDIPALAEVGTETTRTISLDRPDEWIEALVEAVEHPPSREPVDSRKSWSDIADDTVAVYRKVLDAQRAGKLRPNLRPPAPRRAPSGSAAPRVAIVNDWLLNVGGSERVTLELSRMFPGAPVYTSQYDPEHFDWFDGVDVRPTRLQRMPASMKKVLPPLRAIAFRELDLDEFDLVISSSGAEAKAVRTRPGAIHIAYCLSPSHYYWSRYDEYLAAPGFGRLDPLGRLGLRILAQPMRRADYLGAQSADLVLADSAHIQAEVARIYHRASEVVYPPVDIARFAAHARDAEGRHGYVIAGRQTPYKRFDLAVAACTELGLPLTVLGDGPEHDALESLAGPTVTFVREVSDAEMPVYLAGAEAFLFPGLEDFGITPVEAMAAGTPVLAYQAGGALEYVKPELTGLFFAEQTVDALVEALEASRDVAFDHAKIAADAERFAPARFRQEMADVIGRYLPELAAAAHLT